MSRIFDLSNFSGPAEFRKAVPHVSLPFCLATSKIMEKYRLCFAEACDFLEEEGYLFWAGTTPIYNLAGDRLWRDEEVDKTQVEKTPIEAIPKEETISIYTTDTEISCVFFTLVVRNEALDMNYKGGHEAFVGRYLSKYNDDIIVLIAMDTDDLEEAIADIIEQGLIRGDDFHTFDAIIIDSIEDDDQITDANTEGYYFRVDTLPWDVRAAWLQACIHDGSYYVSIRESEKATVAIHEPYKASNIATRWLKRIMEFILYR